MEYKNRYYDNNIQRQQIQGLGLPVYDGKLATNTWHVLKECFNMPEAVT